METRHPVLMRLACVVGLGAILVAILALPSNLLWLKSSLLMFWASAALLLSVRLFFMPSGIFLMFYAGCVIGTLFLFWLGNMALKILLNPVFTLIDLEFRIGNLFTGGWHYALSLPGLICGVVLAAVALLWDAGTKYHLFRAAIVFFQRIN